ncbi:lysophospholipase [Nocardioides sp. HDW12B]|uniref:alpha/beta hydrolase n=1 Tax=Nocardioides sp. HDW12B TaxID=2714939 RepID=UPI00140B3942|nr:lysophospholipase [Nocardioides sp. HDW12B]QIK68207.1 lysophospholipase [Nocardioides sp. HDW12B]
MSSPRLVATRTPDRPRGAVVVLHGGGARRGDTAVSPAQLSVLRMVPIAQRIARAGRGDLAVLRLLNSTRGWDTRHTPVDDARWALGEIAERYGDVPVALVGHSLGGRAALLAGDTDGVRSVVALNAWVTPDDRVDLTGRQVLMVHGTDDRIASPARAERMARDVARTADVFGYVRVEGGKHAMLSNGGAFTRAASDFVTATLLGHEVGGSVAQVLGGASDVSA